MTRLNRHCRLIQLVMGFRFEKCAYIWNQSSEIMIDETFIMNHSLLECLREFKGAQKHDNLSRLESVTEEFKALAKKFLYGGHFVVGDYFEITIDNVEFYYHEEEQLNPADELILDPIVYHKNSEDRKVPPFPIMSLHTHQSGIDIAFEDPKGRYRASVLIREFSVIDRYNKKKEPKADSRSQYLYDYLNGFSIDGNPNYIHWEPEENFTPDSIFVGHRKNVFTPEYKSWVQENKKKVNPDKNNEQRLEELDNRLWAFSKRQSVVRHSNGAKETYQ